MHWHPNADEQQYFIAGQGQLTVFNTGPQVVTKNFNPGDIAYVKRAFGHYIRNTGNTDLVYLEVFNSAYYSEVSLSDWLIHTPRAMVAQTMNVDPAIIDGFPKGRRCCLYNGGNRQTDASERPGVRPIRAWSAA